MSKSFLEQMVVVAIFVGLCIATALIISCNVEKSDNIRNERMNLFCMSLTGTNYTDYGYTNILVSKTYIECNHTMRFTAKEVNACVKFDKWGTCTKYRQTYIMTGNLTPYNIGTYKDNRSDMVVTTYI